MATSSARPGLGAVPFSGGVTFRTWAPFAGSVHVAGDFNGWSQTATPLAREDTGYWSADVAGALAGQQYKLVVNGDWRIDPRAREVTNSIGNAVVVSPEFAWSGASYSTPPWNELVIYELHAATFPDHEVPTESLFEAVELDLPYLHDLGINAIELLPTNEFPGDVSWGYNPSHIFAVESSYGGPDSLKRLVDAAHRLGIAVILDVVYNHLGPNDLAIWQYDGWFEHFAGEAMGGIYFYNDWRARTPWGHKNRPDFGRPEVRAFLRDNALMWLEEFQVDGLRFDATNYIRTVDGGDTAAEDPRALDGWGLNLLRWITDEVGARQPWKLTIAEDMQGNAVLVRPTGAGGAGFSSQWDAGFHHTLRHAVVTPADEGRDMHAVARVIRGDAGAPLWNRVIFTESHDETAAANGKRRVPDDIHPGDAESWHARKRSTLAAAVMLTSPGIPMLLQGQEILEWRPFGDQHRIDWDRRDRFEGIFFLYRDLVRLRRNWFNTTRGLRGPHVNVFHINDADKVLAWHRWADGGPGDDVLVVANFGTRAYDRYTVGAPRAGLWRVRFNSDARAYSPDFGDHPCFDSWTIDAPRDGLPCQVSVGLGRTRWWCCHSRGGGGQALVEVRRVRGFVGSWVRGFRGFVGSRFEG